MNSRTALALALAGVLAAPAVPAQTCNSAIIPSAPDSRYVVNSAKGTVLDRQTGLTWKRCVEGRSGADCGTGSFAELNWGAALRQAEASTFAGYRDWRLPNSKELESLVEVACYGPALNATVFPNDPSTGVWSSSPDGPIYAWNVHFGHGKTKTIFNIYGYLKVRLVRGGQ